MSNDGPIFFWHPDDADYPFLSQHHICQFTDENGRVYTSTEQYMMYHKAFHFNDIPASIEILETTNARRIKHLGRKVKEL
ncbi:hypothetical protein EAE96_001881 [Botrytis aclada]|nr:hypothetical protein EAE96_001881 [Botrytis aclada]